MVSYQGRQRVDTLTLRRWLREARERVPPILPVRFRRAKLDGALGYTTMSRSADGRPSHFIIVLHSDLSHDAAWQVLVHEWAHCLAWQEGHETMCDHDAPWGVALAHVYQELCDI